MNLGQSTPQDNVALLHQYTIILYVFGDLADEMEFQAEACGDDLLSRIKIDLRGVFPGNNIDVGPCTHATYHAWNTKSSPTYWGLRKLKYEVEAGLAEAMDDILRSAKEFGIRLIMARPVED